MELRLLGGPHGAEGGGGMIVWPNTQGERNPNARLTETDVRRIRSRAASGTPHKDIAREFGVAQSTVSKIVRRGLWGHVTK